ncbi:MAG: HD domain-containing protein [Haliscomenobacter sp.]|nr:HD domain-containing protein [Haliscomenobacter sp.]
MGKIAIPDEILQKPGPLNDTEWEKMRRHPSYAYEMLSRIEYLRPALDIPFYHHERWNGSGYPHGLAARRFRLRRGSLPSSTSGTRFAATDPTARNCPANR